MGSDVGVQRFVYEGTVKHHSMYESWELLDWTGSVPPGDPKWIAEIPLHATFVAFDGKRVRVTIELLPADSDSSFGAQAP